MTIVEIAKICDVDNTTIWYWMVKLNIPRRNIPHNWKGGKTKEERGFIKVLQSDGKYIKEHRLEMERYLGRKLNPKEVVHHKNCIKDDNRIENLKLMTNSGHTILHWRLRKGDI